MSLSDLQFPGYAGTAFLLLMLVLVPYGAIRSRGQLHLLAAIPRDRYFRSVVIQQIIFLGLGALVAWAEYLPVRVGRVDPLAILLAVALFLAAVFGMQPTWRRKVRERDERLALFAPRTPIERRWWVALSITAGISEEFIWRGVLISLLWIMTGSWLAAAVVSSVIFGVSHAVQGARSAATIAALAMVVAWFAHWTGGLLLVMLIHAGYDVVAGMMYARLMEAAGIPDARLDGTPKEESAAI